MASQFYCPECGGIIGATGTSDEGRPCTCGSNSATATTTAPQNGGSSAMGPRKLCVACGKDVTRAKRMRDKDSKYWCVDCGQADSMRKKAALAEQAIIARRTTTDKPKYGKPSRFKPANKGRFIAMIVVAIALAVFSWWNLTHH